MISVVPVAWARENFSQVLLMAQREPIAIARHGRTMAVLWPPGSPYEQARERIDLGMWRRYYSLWRRSAHQEMAMRLQNMHPEAFDTVVMNTHRQLHRPDNVGSYGALGVQRWDWVLRRSQAQLPWMICNGGSFGESLRMLSPMLATPFPQDLRRSSAERLLQRAVECGAKWACGEPLDHHAPSPRYGPNGVDRDWVHHPPELEPPDLECDPPQVCASGSGQA